MNASVNVVMLAPKHTAAGVAPNNVATVARVPSSSASVASAAAKRPPLLALRPLVAQSVIAAIAESTICVPAGPSKRAHPSRTPGNRGHNECRTMPRVCQPS